MRKRSILLLQGPVVACLLAAWPGPTVAYIKAPPQTLGGLCFESAHICVLKVDKVNAERGVILFKHVGQLKGMHNGSVVKHVLKPEIKGAKIILDWAAEGKTAVMFYFTGGNDRGHVCIDGYWYWVAGINSAPPGKNSRPDIWWSASQGEPILLTLYSGSPDKLAEAVKKILKGEEVTVPAMAGDNRQDLEQRRGRIQDRRASLKLVGADSVARVADRPEGKNPGKKLGPGDPNSGGKMEEEWKGDVVGTVKGISDDGKSFTLLRPPSMKTPEPTPIDIQISEHATITAGKEPGKLAVGQRVSVWFGKGEGRVAMRIVIGKAPLQPEKPTPEDKRKKPVPEDRGKEPMPERGADNRPN